MCICITESPCYAPETLQVNYTSIKYIYIYIYIYNGEGNGTPLQYSCLENPMDGGAW